MKFLRDVDTLVMDRHGVPSEEHFTKGDVIDVKVSEAPSADMVQVEWEGNTAILCREDVEFSMFTDVARRTYVIQKTPTRRWDLFEKTAEGLKRVDRGGYSRGYAEDVVNRLLDAGHTVETPDEWGDAPDGH